MYIHSPSDGTLKLNADTEIDLTAPTIDINGTTNISGILTMSVGDSTNPRLTFAGTQVSGTHYIQIDRGSSAMEFYVNDSNRMEIGSTGNVGIGVEPISTAKVLIRSYSPSGFQDVLLLEDSSGSDLFTFESDGDFRLNTYGSGTLSVGSSGLVQSSSDSSLKNQVSLTIPGLSAVLQLSPKAYSWKEADEERAAQDPPLDPVVELGFFADEVKDIIPEAAPINDRTGKYGLYDRGLIAVLTKAIQEQQVIIDDLKARIETLEG